MATLGDTVTRILQDLNRGSGHSARAVTAIVEAIEYYQAHRFAWNQERTAIQTTPLTEYASLPSQWISMDDVRLDDDAGRYLLTARTPAELDATGTDENETGKPVAYAIDNRQLRLWPVPDATYSIHLQMLITLPEISAGAGATATNAWLTEGFKLIYHHAMADLLATYISGDEAIGQAQIHRIGEQDVLRELERRLSVEQSTGRFRAQL